MCAFSWHRISSRQEKYLNYVSVTGLLRGGGKTEITARECFKLEEGVGEGRAEGGSGSNKYVYGAIVVLAEMAHR